MILTKALIRLRERAGWSAHFLFVNPRRPEVRVEARFVNPCHGESIYEPQSSC